MSQPAKVLLLYAHPESQDSVANRVYIAFDGEGCNPAYMDEDGIWIEGDHRYTYMAACDTLGQVEELNAREGEDFIRTEDALKMYQWLSGLTVTVFKKEHRPLFEATGPIVGDLPAGVDTWGIPK